MKKISTEDLHILNNELYLLAIENLHLIEWKEYIQQAEATLTNGVKEQILKKFDPRQYRGQPAPLNF